MSARPTLVVLRALGLGDFLTGVPAYRALAAAFPEHRRLLAAPRALAALLPLVPALDGLLATPGLDAELDLRAPDVAVNLHGRGPRSHRLLLRLEPRQLIAFAHADVPESRRGPTWRAAEHEVARWCRLLQSAGIAANASQLSIARPAAFGARRPGYTLIHPGAASAARRWPLERWSALASAERAAGRQVVLSGGPSEHELVSELARRSGLEASDCALGHDLERLAALVSDADLLLCGDTGIAHLATALSRTSVVLFGPTAPARWGPPADRPWHRVLWAGREGDPHASQVDPGLLRISVADVQQEIARLRRDAQLRCDAPEASVGAACAPRSGARPAPGVEA